MPDRDQCTSKLAAVRAAAKNSNLSKPFQEHGPGESPGRPEAPRERLLRAGPEALDDAELLGLILPSEAPDPTGDSETRNAAELLQRVGSLQGLARLEHHDQSLGLETAHKAVLLAMAEWSRRLSKARIPGGEMLHRPELVAEYLRLRYDEGDQEVMGALYLDANHRLLFEAEVFRGARHRALVEPGPILRRALVAQAPAFLLFHTHPGGDPNPSAEDRAFTHRVGRAGAIVGTLLLDHLIIGSSGRWRSMRREVGPWPWS